MLTLAWRGVRHNTGRYIATLVAIITGVAFFAAAGFVGDRITRALEGDVDRQFAAVDVAIVVEDGADFADDLRIDGSVAEDIAALPGVEAVGGDLSGSVAFLGSDGTTFADGAVGRLWISDDALNPIDVDEGTAPLADGEIAVDAGLAEDEDIDVGDELTVLTLAGEFDVTVVGITTFGDSDAQDQSGTVSIPAPSAFDWLNSGQVEFEDLYVRGTVDETALLEAVEPLVPDGFDAQTGDDFRSDKRGEVAGFGRVLKITMQAFAMLALFVGGFVIYNTFNVIVSQRVRELAVLSAIGATPKQLKRSLRFEGVVIGLIGSVLGVVAGFALALGLAAILAAADVSLPGSGVALSSGVVIQGVIVGTLITYMSVTIPARRASRTEPIEALRQSAAETGTVSRGRMVATGVLAAIGVLGLLQGGAPLVALGVLSMFVAVIMGGPLIAIAGSRLLRPAFSRFGLEGRLAVDNVARNPQRTATTSNALLIGVFLVTLVSVAGTSAKDYAVAEINSLSSADYVIESDGGTIDDGLVADLEGVTGVEAVTPFRRESVTVDGEPGVVSTGDVAAIAEAASIELAEGSFDDLVAGTILLLPSTAGGSAIGAEDDPSLLGSVVTLVDAAGDSAELEVVGVLETSIDTISTGSFVATDTFDGFVGDTAPTVAFLDAATGVESDTEDAIEALTDRRPDITLTRGNTIGQLIGAVFDFLISAVNGLLLMSVAVALIGIVNTLSLSILERRRELGLLRVVGMVDERVRRMVRLESVLISALGTVTGVAFGVFTGWALIYTIDRASDADLGFSLPGRLLLVVLALGIGLGFLASLVPASRSTRLDVLDAIEAT